MCRRPAHRKTDIRKSVPRTTGIIREITVHTKDLTRPVRRSVHMGTTIITITTIVTALRQLPLFSRRFPSARLILPRTVTYVQNVDNQERVARPEYRNDAMGLSTQDMAELDSGIEANGILEVMPDGFGFIRCENFLPGENDVYVAPSQIRRFNLKTGDIIVGNRRVKAATEKFAALLYIKTVNGYPLSATETRPNFEDLTPIFPNQRLHMENPREKTSVAMRVLDLLAPIGKGQRGMIVSAKSW